MPTAPWLIAENAKPGTLNWICNHVQPDHALEGFASQVSAVPGDDVALFVNTTARGGAGPGLPDGLLPGPGRPSAWQSDFVPAGAQPAPAVDARHRHGELPVEAHHDAQHHQGLAARAATCSSWSAAAARSSSCPLTIRDDASMASYVIQNSVTTWQAYNLWGDYSLYYGPQRRGRPDFANRARAVSFDRPYPQTWASGAADFVGNELPLLFHLESLGLDLTYWTDVDLHARPQLLANHRCLFSLGHDEYWSQPMRQGAAQANAAGVNLAFLGANACYRQIRMEPTSVGPNRLAGLLQGRRGGPDGDAAARRSPRSTGTRRRSTNPSRRSSAPCTSPSARKADMVVTDASSWFYDGCNLSDGHVVPQGDPRGVRPLRPVAARARATLDVLAHSPVPGQSNWSDITYYTAPGNGGGVLASGSASFVSMISTTGVDPLHRDPRPVPGRHRRHAPGHGERLRPLRAGARQLLRQLRAATGPRSTPAPPPRRVPPPAPHPPDLPPPRRIGRAGTAHQPA